MQTLPSDYLAEIARQSAFLSAFLGGFAATFLATLLAMNSPKPVAGWSIGCAAFAACGFIVSATASVMLTVVLRPDAPSNVLQRGSIAAERLVGGVGFLLGIYALLLSVGTSGWIRSRRTGIATSVAAILGAVIVMWITADIG